MRSYRTLALVLAVWAGTSAAQYQAVPQAGIGYPALTNPQTVTLLAAGDAGIELDRGRALLQLPFSFQFYNRQYTAVYVTANGALFFEPTTNPNDDFPSNVAIPSTTEPNGVIAPFWEDLDGNNGSSAVRQQVVSGPNGQGLAIEWRDWNRRFGSYTLNFQVRLWENGVIEFFYGTMQGAGQAISATIGIESPTGAQGTNGLGPIANPAVDGGQQFRCLNRTNPNAPVPSFAHCDLSSFDPLNTGTPISYIRFGPPPGVDLQPTRVRITGIAQAGNDLQLNVETSIRNFGTVASPPFSYKLYLSQDTIFDPPLADGGVSDSEIVTPGPRGPFTLNPNAAIVDSAGGVAPRPTSGTFYVLAVADPEGLVTETNENNNVFATSTPFFAGVDLVAESVSGPPSAGPGDPVTVSYTFTNQGFDPPGVVPFKIYLSADTVFSGDDRQVFSGTRAVSGGETVIAQSTFLLPSTVPAEDYFILLVLDDGPTAGVIVEVSDANNQVFSRARMQVRQADLIVERIRVARPVTPFETATAAFFGESIRIEATVRNQGGASAPNVSLIFYLSDNETLNGLTDPFICDEGPFALAPGTSRTVEKTCTVPSLAVSGQPLVRGPFFFFAAATAAGLAETDPSNNFAQAPPLLVRSPAPNLLPTNLRGPLRAAAGEVFAVTRTLANTGNRPSPAVRYRYVVSANTVITRDDPVLPIVTPTGDVAERSVTLAVDQRDTATELIRIPLSVTPATYYLGVLLDPDELVDEVDKADNGLAGPLTEVVAQSLGVAPTALPDALVNQPYLAELSATGTAAASTFVARVPAELPPGLTLSMDGRMAGTPTRTGAYAFTVAVTAGGRTIDARLSLKVSRSTASLVLTTTLLPPPARLLTYDFQAGATGGVGPYRFLVSNGVLPSGLVLSDRGRLSGSPSGDLGTSTTFTLSVVDSVGNVDSRVFTMTVVDASPFRITTAALLNGTLGEDYLVDIESSNAGGAPVSRPVRWTVLEGTLPPGLTLENSATERVIISGQPTGAGLFRFRLEATDNQGRSDSVGYVVLVAGNGVSILGELPPSLDRGAQVSVQLSASARVDGARFVVMDGSLPPGVSIDDAGLVTGTIDAEAAYRSYTITVGYGAGRDQLVTMKALRIDVEPPREIVRRGCASTGGVGLSALLALAGLTRRRRR
ncbi:MAG: CARDB domain-containing protein [Myxococcaceae bacterium]|nr:CARDB domain-containing protein [Myxococcaceae bacterium]